MTTSILESHEVNARAARSSATIVDESEQANCNGRLRGSLRWAWLVACLLLAGWFGLGAVISGGDPANRRTKNIEDIRAGDMVLAADPETGVVEPHRVVRLFQNRKDHLRIVHVRNDSGEMQRIETTDEHPFFVADRGWIMAAELQPDDSLTQADGGFATVQTTEREDHPAGIPTFNFEVEGFHTYFVAAHGSTGPPVLVHNTCPEVKPIDKTRPQHGTVAHDATAYKQAKKWATESGPGKVRFNQQLVDADGNAVPGYRPDAQRIRELPDGRKVVDVLEVRSPGQNDTFMDAKKEAMIAALGDQAGDIRWIEPTAGATR